METETKCCITRTPPRTAYVVGGKRDRPASPPSFASTGDSVVNMDQVIPNAPSFFSFSSQHQKEDGCMVNAVATVSPFMVRVDEDNMNNIINHHHLESVPEEQSQCNNYDLTQSSIDDHNSNSRLTFEVDDDVIYYSNLPDCPPPTKRPRLEDDTTHHSSASSFSIINTNDVDMLDGGALPPLSPNISCKTKMKSELLTSSDSSSSNANDEGLVIRCCHVCSVEDHGENITTTTPHVEKHSVETLRDVSGGGGNNGPRSHSLLAYFQPTKRLPAMHQRALVSHYLAVVPSRSSSSRDDVITLSSNNNINDNNNQQQQHQQRVLNLSACRYCDKPTCITCTRQCELCLHCYCIFCTKVNYESSVAERLLCFECDEQQNCNNRRGGGGASASGGYTMGEESSCRREDVDCDMMDNLL
jgi:hypothetical protein